MDRMLELARRAYEVIAPPGSAEQLRMSKRAEAWSSLVLCVVMACITAWACVYGASSALFATNGWLSALGWLVAVVGALSTVLFAGLATIVVFGSGVLRSGRGHRHDDRS